MHWRTVLYVYYYYYYVMLIYIFVQCYQVHCSQD